MNVRRSFLNGLAWTGAFTGLMAVLGVVAFHFPEYLTTQRLRAVYQEAQVRNHPWTARSINAV